MDLIMPGAVPPFPRDFTPEDFMNLILAVWGVVSLSAAVVYLWLKPKAAED